MTASSNTLELQAGDLRLALRPDLGGCIAGLWLGGLPVLRSGDPPALAHPRDAGCFPLVPYSNRLGYRRFRWQGRDHALLPNFGDNPHSLHGVAWQRAWQVVHTEATAAELCYRHAADGHWPFDFEVRQRFELAPDTLRLSFVLTNTASLAQPAGLGWHPYFPKRSRSRLHVELTDRWETDASLLPTRKVAQPGIDGDLAHLDFDHCFEGWSAPARLRDEKLSLTLSSSLPYLVVYTPPTADHFCVEPVSHVSNAIHMADPAAHGLRTLRPGEVMEGWMQLEIARV
jgi:aldose 1-epimerase